MSIRKTLGSVDYSPSGPHGEQVGEVEVVDLFFPRAWGTQTPTKKQGVTWKVIRGWGFRGIGRTYPKTLKGTWLATYGGGVRLYVGSYSTYLGPRSYPEDLEAWLQMLRQPASQRASDGVTHQSLGSRRYEPAKPGSYKLVRIYLGNNLKGIISQFILHSGIKWSMVRGLY